MASPLRSGIHTIDRFLGVPVAIATELRAFTDADRAYIQVLGSIVSVAQAVSESEKPSGA
jgi:hypothetical protein